MEITAIFVLVFFLYFVIACEIRGPWREYRKLDREFKKSLHNICPFPRDGKSYLDELWENVYKPSKQ